MWLQRCRGRERALTGKTWFLLAIASSLIIGEIARGGDSKAALRVEPAEISLHGPAAEHGVLVGMPGADGRWRDLMREAAYSISDTKVATVTADGRIRSVSDGETELVVSAAGQTGRGKIRVAGASSARVPSFRHEVNPILTRFGCSQGACHGKQDGQNGFKLSLRGFIPEGDYEAVVLQSQGRRIFHAAPDLSLILAKPAGRIPHRGGVLLQTDSGAYRAIVEWIRSGTPRLPADEPSLDNLEALGGDRVMKAGQEQPLLVRAFLTDGRVFDVTWISKFYVNDPSVLEVTPEGRVKAKREGVSTVRAHFEDKVAIAGFTIPHERTVDASLYAARQNGIDGPVFDMLASMKIPPSPACTDAEFVRRAFIDTIGTLPRPEEVSAFLADTDAGKRARLVDDLLKRPEFVDYWALLLGDLLQ